MTDKQLPKVRGQGLTMDQAIRAFEQYGTALRELEPIDMRAAAKARMSMDAQVLGAGRFLYAAYWRKWWRAYGW